MNITFLPFLLPTATAALGLTSKTPTTLRRAFFLTSCLIQVALSIYLCSEAYAGQLFVLTLGNWDAPFGICLVVDLLSALMLTAGAVTCSFCTLYGFYEQSTAHEHPLRFPLMQFLLAGTQLSFITGDLFNLYVSFEILLIASYSLMTLEADDNVIHRAFPYLTVNLFGSLIFLIAAGCTYCMFGSLNLADLSEKVQFLGTDTRLLVVSLMLLFVFGLKAALFPFYFWLPDSYPILPSSIGAFFSGLLTKVGVYSILRLFGTIFPEDLTFTHQVMVVLAAISMTLGAFGGISRHRLREIFSYQIVTSVGWMILAIGFFTPLALTAAILYMMHAIIVKSSLFLIGGACACFGKSDHLDDLHQLYKPAPWLGAVFLMQGLSLAGIPPFSGFWGKYLIILEGMSGGHYFVVFMALATGMLTLFNMLRVWNRAFWAPAKGRPPKSSNPRWVAMTTIAAGMAAVALFIGLGAELWVKLSSEATNQLLNKERYTAAVFASYR